MLGFYCERVYLNERCGKLYGLFSIALHDSQSCLKYWYTFSRGSWYDIRNCCIVRFDFVRDKVEFVWPGVQSCMFEGQWADLINLFDDYNYVAQAHSLVPLIMWKETRDSPSLFWDDQSASRVARRAASLYGPPASVPALRRLHRVRFVSTYSTSK